MTDTTVVVVDDHPLFRQGVVATVNAIDGFSVVAECSSLAEAERELRVHSPGLMLLDVNLPDGDGASSVGALLGVSPGTRVIMLTVSSDSDTVLLAMRAGAKGYLLKGASARELERAVRTVSAGDTYSSSEVALRVLEEVTHRPRPSVDALTERELSVFELLGRGLTNREIADTLFLSEKTVKGHVTVVMQKLGVRNRVEAALIAARRNGA